MSAALPNTYHQLAVLRGTGCSAASRIGAAELQALVEPFADLARSGAWRFPLRCSAALGPGVGSSPA